MGKQRKGARQQQQQQTTEEDDLEFLEAQARLGRERREHEAEERRIPDSVFEGLPPPPSTTITDRSFPQREIMPHNEHVGARPLHQEEADRLAELQEALPDYREGGLIHQEIREWAMSSGVIRPGVQLYQMCSQIEEAVRRQTVFHPPDRGLAFPCGCSINRCAAHYSPLPGDQTVLGESDVMKIDFGVSVNGHIIDSAFTVCFDDRFKPLIDASKEATECGIRMAGPDARLSEIGEAIEEVITSHTIELDGKVYTIKPVKNLCGHQMSQYIIHCGKMIPICKSPRPETDKMEFGEVYALETFATTGKGIVFDDGATSHFMVSQRAPPVRAGPMRDLFNFLKENYRTMAFSQRAIERVGRTSYSTTLEQLIKAKVVDAYPPLSDVVGSYVSQHEHSFAILEHHKEIFSR